jgi:hypothetical protein
MRSSIVCTLHHILLEWSNQGVNSACSMHGKKRNTFKILFGKSEGRRPFGSPWYYRWENNVKMILVE